MPKTYKCPEINKNTYKCLIIVGHLMHHLLTHYVWVPTFKKYVSILTHIVLILILSFYSVGSELNPYKFCNAVCLSLKIKNNYHFSKYSIYNNLILHGFILIKIIRFSTF